jgi:hypothetical protein
MYRDVKWDKAACAEFPINLFYAVEEERTARYLNINAVRNICLGCPIIQDCLEYSFKNERWGMWGGMVGVERRAFMQGSDTPQTQEVVRAFEESGLNRNIIYNVLPERWVVA